MARPKPEEPAAALGFRLPVSLIARIDSYARDIERKLPGHKVTRTDAIRVLLEKATAAEGFPAVEKAKGKR